MVKIYNIEGGINFFDELYKSLDIQENTHKCDDDNNRCLITNEILTDTYSKQFLLENVTDTDLEEFDSESESDDSESNDSDSSVSVSSASVEAKSKPSSPSNVTSTA